MLKLNHVTSPLRRIGPKFAFLLLLGFAWHAHAQLTNPEGFETPAGYRIHENDHKSFGVFDGRGEFDCLEKGVWVACRPAHGPFDTKGLLRLEGKIESTSYKPLNKDSSNYLLYQNYRRVILQAGGRHIARFRGGLEARDFFMHVFLIEKAGVKRWIIFDAYGAGQYAPRLNIVTQTEAPNILGAIELQQQIESQGFATLYVNFDTAKAVIRPEDEPALAEVVKLMAASPRLRLSVEGHTDNVGSAQANKDLSLRRSKAIMDHLIAQGVQASRLQAVGRGQEMPIADNRKEEGRAQNRRVELVKLP